MAECFTCSRTAKWFVQGVNDRRFACHFHLDRACESSTGTLVVSKLEKRVAHG